MKNVNELLQRAIILTCLSDRCAQEKNVIGGIPRSLTERNQQCVAICNWMERMGYIDNCTEAEKIVFHKKVEKKSDVEVMQMQIDYECIEPILWSLGLIDKLSNYNDFVITDFHPVLMFGRNHSLKELSSKCKLVSQDEFIKKREEAMLVYWRCIEAHSDVIKEKGLDIVIEEIFGEHHVDILKDMELFDDSSKDFRIKQKIVGELNNAQLIKLTQIAEKRFYSFEWMADDDAWDEVDLVC